MAGEIQGNKQSFSDYDRFLSSVQTNMAEQLENLEETIGRQVTARESLQESESETSFSGMVKTGTKTIPERALSNRKVEKASETVLVSVDFEEAANDLLEKQPDLLHNEDKAAAKARLTALVAEITPSMSEEEILATVQKFCNKVPVDKQAGAVVDVLKFLEVTAKSNDTKNVVSMVRKTCEFCVKNPEFVVTDLIKLRGNIKPGMLGDQVLKEIEKTYGQLSAGKTETASLIHKALTHLQEVAPEEMQDVIAGERKKFYTDNRNEIIYSRNIESFVQAGSKGGIPAQELRDLHNKMKGDLPELNTIFNELITKFPSVQQLNEVAKFEFHALGEELKFKTFEQDKRQLPEAGELSALMRTRQSMTAIFGIIKFIKGREELLTKQIEDLKGGL